MWYNPPDETKRESFHHGTCFDAYRFLGAHPVDENGEMKWHFTVWAPNAKKVSVTGEFCDWALEAYPMEKQYDGTWELRLPAILFTPESTASGEKGTSIRPSYCSGDKDESVMA